MDDSSKVIFVNGQEGFTADKIICTSLDIDIPANKSILSNFDALFDNLRERYAQISTKGINNVMSIYLKLCEEIEAQEDETIKLIDKYMRMFFDAVVFTRIDMKNHLVTESEQAIIDAIQTKLPPDNNQDRESFIKEIQVATEGILNNLVTIDSETSFNTYTERYRKSFQQKNAFNVITHSGLIRYENINCLLAFDFSKLETNQLARAKVLIEIALLLAAGALLRRHKQEGCDGK